MCLNGVWGAICQTGWSKTDAAVFCKGLGYYGKGRIGLNIIYECLVDPRTYYGAYFGETNGPVVLSNIGCSGYESSIQKCSKIIQPNFNCSQKNTAGVLCKDCK